MTSKPVIKQTISTVLIDRQQLPLPTVDYAQGAVLNPAHVPANGTYLRVPASAATQNQDVVWVYWTGPTEVEGTDTFTDWIPINSFTAGQPLEFAIALKYVTNNNNKSVNLRYTITRAGQILPSPVLTLAVGQALPNLPAPSVLQAVAGSLNPINAQLGVDVVVRYSDMSAEDLITLEWRGSAGIGTPTLPARPGNASGAIQIPIDASVVAANIGKTVTLLYKVARNGATAVESNAMTLNVAYFNPEDLPSTHVEQSRDGVLDMNTFDGAANVVVAPWPLIQLNQRFWLTATGTRSDGSTFNRVIAFSLVTSQHIQQGLHYALLPDDLKSLRHNSNLQLHLQVAFDGTSNNNQAQDFPDLTLTIAAAMLPLPALDIVQATAATLDPMHILGATTARISYASMQPSDTIVLYYRDSDGSDHPVGTFGSGSLTQTQFLSIPHSLISYHLNKNLNLHYRVIPADFHSPGGLAPNTVTTVLPFSPQILRAPVPEYAKKGILDLSSFAGDALVVLENWFFMAANQRVWLTASGIDNAGGSVTLELASGEIVLAAQVGFALVFEMKRTELQSLKNREYLTFKTWVSFDGGAQQQQALPFPESRIQIQH